MTGDPFRALGLPAEPGLTDDDVRAAWRRVAAATHPDRADGGDPAAFAAAANAYSELRTPFGRSEALADLSTTPGGRARGEPAALWRRRAGAARSRAGRAGAGRAGAARFGAGRAGRADTEPGRRRRRPGAAVGWASRVRRGRPGCLALRVVAAAAVSVLVVIIAGWQPATPALMVGALTWLVRSGRRDLAARPPAGGRDTWPPG